MPLSTLRRIGLPLLMLMGGGLVWWAAPPEVRPPAAPHAATIMVHPGTPRPLAPDFLGYNAPLIERGFTFADAPVRAAFAGLHAGHVRYPGGTIGNYWDWRTGWFNAAAPERLARRRHQAPYTLDGLATLHRETGVMPLFQLNILTDSLASQIEMLRTAAGLGLPVRYVELGNEFYLPEDPYIARFATPEAYLAEVRAWVAGVKAAFPAAQVAVVAASPSRYGTAHPRREGWNRAAAVRAAGADAVTLHFYTDTGLKGRPPETGQWGSAEEQRRQWTHFTAPGGVEAMLAMPFAYLARVRERRAGWDEMPVWVTEFSLFDRVGGVRGTWAHGLYVAAYVAEMLAMPEVTLASYHGFAPNPVFSATFFGPDDYAGLTVDSVATTPFAPTAVGTALALWGTALTGAHTATPLVFADGPVVEAPDGSTFPALVGWHFAAADGPRLLLMNLSDTAHPAALAALVGEPMHQRQVYAAPTTRVGSAAALADRQTRYDPAEGALVVPPYALVVLTPVSPEPR